MSLYFRLRRVPGLKFSQSKECQTISWKLSHKVNCAVHASLKVTDQGTFEAPAKDSKEWQDMELDKHLSKWLALWRSVFCDFATAALDLPNYPMNRVITHCPQIVVQATKSKNPKRKYEVAHLLIFLYAPLRPPGRQGYRRDLQLYPEQVSQAQSRYP
jgi:hypothetical protein